MEAGCLHPAAFSLRLMPRAVRAPRPQGKPDPGKTAPKLRPVFPGVSAPGYNKIGATVRRAARSVHVPAMSFVLPGIGTG
jgi:hypothetical protein